MNTHRPDLPDDLKPLLDLSSLEREIREPGGSDHVEERLKYAVENYPDHGVPLAAWAWFLARNEDFVGAVAWQSRAIEKGPEEFRGMWRTQRAGYRFRAGDWQAGFREFRELIEADPANPVPRIARSFEMRSMGDHVSGELDEIFTMHMVGNVTSDSLFVFFRQHGAFSTPERLKASLFVLSDPLDAIARIHRGEMFMAMGAPLAAYYDLHLADVLTPRNLGLMARLEDIRTRGILADPPLYEVAVPATPILPDYQKVLVEYTTFLERFAPSAVRGVDLGWFERVFGRAGTEPTDFGRTNRNFAVSGLAIGLAADFVLVAGAILIDAFAPAMIEPLKEFESGDVSLATALGGAVLVAWTLAVFAGSVISAIGAVQQLFGCRIADLPAAVSARRWFVRPFLGYGLSLLYSSLLVVSVLMHVFLVLSAIAILSIAADFAGVATIAVRFAWLL